MQVASIFSQAELSFLKALNKHEVEYILVGASAATLQGAPVVTQGVDLWFKDIGDQNIRNALADVKATFVPSFGSNPPRFFGECVKLFDPVLFLHGVGQFEEEQENTHEIDLKGVKVKVLNLERIILSKKTANRAKDQLTLPVLEDTLKAIRILKKAD